MRTHFTLFIALFTLASLAQSPQPFPVSDASWSVVNTFPTGGFPPDTGMMTITYGYDGEKPIGGHVYTNLYHTHEPVFIPGGPDNYFSGLVREENGYVFFMNFGQDEPDTLYNFNLLPGDTATLFRFCCGSNYTMTLNSIDSVLINDEYHRRFVFDTVWDYTSMLAEVWIEGIGSHHGILFPNTARLFSADFPDNIDLTCFTHESAIYWQNPDYDNCYMNTLTALPEKDSRQALQIYPNPVDEYVVINLRSISGTGSALRIYNLTGNVVYEDDYSVHTQQAIINLNELQAGLYFIELTSSDQRLISKLVKR